MSNCWSWWRHLARSPRRVGSIFPSSVHLARNIVHCVTNFLPGGGPGRVIEVGAGTGAITGLLARHFGPKGLVVVEVDPACCRYLRRRFPRLEVIEGLVENVLPRLISPCPRLAIVSSVPLFSLTRSQRDRVLGAYESLVATTPRCRIVQYTYVPWLPESRTRQLCGREVFPVWQNVPPAWVWSTTHQGTG